MNILYTSYCIYILDIIFTPLSYFLNRVVSPFAFLLGYTTREHPKISYRDMSPGHQLPRGTAGQSCMTYWPDLLHGRSDSDWNLNIIDTHVTSHKHANIDLQWKYFPGNAYFKIRELLTSVYDEEAAHNCSKLYTPYFLATTWHTNMTTRSKEQIGSKEKSVYNKTKFQYNKVKSLNQIEYIHQKRNKSPFKALHKIGNHKMITYEWKKKDKKRQVHLNNNQIFGSV